MKSIKNHFLILIIITLANATNAANAAEKVISLTSNEFPPYHSNSLMNQGPVTELIIAAYERVGYRVEVTYFPWARGDFFASKGQDYDGVISIWRTKERENKYFFSDSYMDNEIGFYKRKSNVIKYSSYKALKQYTVGTVISYANPPGFDSEKLNVKPMVTDKLNIMKLCHDRVDLVLIDRLMAQYLISTNLKECQEEVDWMLPALEIKPMHLAISKNAKDGIEKINNFNRGLNLIRTDGTLNSILRKHGF
jgi:polar amino acid transport system substrate-binding protein